LKELESLTAPDVSLAMLDDVAERLIREQGATPYNKGYKPKWAKETYPATICASVNHEVCHAPPHNKELREGDIVTYDIGIKYKGFCGDAALTVPVGVVSNRKERLMRYSLQALYEGIKVVKAGAKIGDIGEAIERYVGPCGYTIIKEYGGHHIGKEMHELPNIPNYADYQSPLSRETLKEGAVICIEPMLTPGTGEVEVWNKDGWTVFCRDGQPCAMFEAMILVEKEKGEILTKHLPPSNV
jgi:methionyl aminopeptidase